MTDILHITDRERAQAAVIRALESARDEMAKWIEAQQWRPIETAPKDGTRYLACDGKKMWTRNQPPNCYAGDWEWNQNRTQWRGHADGLNPTHWMPLPEALEAGGED